MSSRRSGVKVAHDHARGTGDPVFVNVRRSEVVSQQLSEGTFLASRCTEHRLVAAAERVWSIVGLVRMMLTTTRGI